MPPKTTKRPAAATQPETPRPAWFAAAQPWLSTLARLALGVVWIIAGAQKVGDPAAFVRATRAYDATPEWLTKAIGYGLPYFEIALGVLLIIGIGTRLLGIVSAGLFVVFLIGIIQASARGLQIECGCFGGGGALNEDQDTTYTIDIIRDVAMLIGALFLVVWPRSNLSADDAVFRTATPDPKQVRVGPRRTQQAQKRLAALQARRQREARVRTFSAYGGVAAVLVAVGLIGIWAQSERVDPTGPVTAPPSADSGGFVVGKDSAPVTLDVYEDLICPACGSFEEQIGPDLATMVEDGEIRIRYHMLGFLDRMSKPVGYSTRAANAVAAAAEAGKFEQYHKLLYEHQPTEGSAGLSNEQLIKYGTEAGIKDQKFDDAVRSGTYSNWVRDISDHASKEGVNQTPTLRIDGKDIETPTIDAIKSAVEQARAGTWEDSSSDGGGANVGLIVGLSVAIVLCILALFWYSRGSAASRSRSRR